MRLVKRILLRLYGIVQHLILTQILVSELPLPELLDDTVLLSVILDGLIQLLLNLPDLALVILSILGIVDSGIVITRLSYHGGGGLRGVLVFGDSPGLNFLRLLSGRGA